VEEKNMKKTLIFAMVLCVLALAMTACAGGNTPAPTAAPTEVPAVETEVPAEEPAVDTEVPAEEPAVETEAPAEAPAA
jgi:hypothetical protein